MNYLVICYLLFSLALLLNVQFSTLAYFRFQPQIRFDFPLLAALSALTSQMYCSAENNHRCDVMFKLRLLA